MAGDFTVITIATVIAMVARPRLTVFGTTMSEVSGVIGPAGVGIVAMWLFANLATGTYGKGRLGVGTSEYARILTAAALTAGVVGMACYLTQFNLARGFFALLFMLGVPMLLVWRWIARRVVHRAREKGHLLSRVLVSGSPTHVDEVCKVLERDRRMGYQVVGALLPSSQPVATTPGGIPVCGMTTGAADAVLDEEVDIIVFTEGAFPTSAEFRRTAWKLEGMPVQMVVVPSLSDISAGRIEMRPVGGLPLVHVEQPQSLAASRGLKRAFDIVGAGLLLLLAAPVMLLVALSIRLEDRGPVLFRQARAGRDGTLFDCLKFRSMCTDAEARLAELKDLNVNADGVLFKVKGDPRITRVGRLIRRFSLDELPQLLNVLRGEMSLVGPRPALPDEVSQYPSDAQRRLDVRPGLTGLWQVSGRSDLSWDDAVRLDLYYVDNWSIVQDLTIVMRTIHAVFAARGAY
ncbi:MAG: sugar transferase [Intrasporangium sp.]|uniref:sugar transferase n=1 Tax=Intrasporangium sp. TaxID=1925024 RepID=UPI002649DC1C|nr:sugar transferase [Intrasporangium sp.]MDN5795507.1 sugar transferase [Intrasporangium sp.]